MSETTQPLDVRTETMRAIENVPELLKTVRRVFAEGSLISDPYLTVDQISGIVMLVITYGSILMPHESETNHTTRVALVGTMNPIVGQLNALESQLEMHTNEVSRAIKNRALLAKHLPDECEFAEMARRTTDSALWRSHRLIVEKCLLLLERLNREFFHTPEVAKEFFGREWQRAHCHSAKETSATGRPLTR